MLKEVAGTKVYEQRRAESLKIMADTDAKRGKISELLEYIETRLQELEEEKEELKEFQEKDKERRCLEYALYQRELEEVGEALLEIEEDRKADLHGANIRREKYNEREKETQVGLPHLDRFVVTNFVQDLEREIAEARHSLESVAQTRRDTQAELTDLIRSRTELECIVEDLRAANQNSGGMRDDYEAELEQIEEKIEEKEGLLSQLLPEWEEKRALQAAEKRRLDEATANLSSLFAKQGRASKFRSKSERDVFLRQEITSVSAYKENQESALEAARGDLEQARKSQKEIDGLSRDVQGKMEDGRRRMKELQDIIANLKEQQMEMMERRKDLWREDTKLDSLVSHAADELRTTERLLAGMMDKACTFFFFSFIVMTFSSKDTGQGLKAVDAITERYRLRGVYGPLYRLFEVADPRYNIAVELTAGNRFTPPFSQIWSPDVYHDFYSAYFML